MIERINLIEKKPLEFTYQKLLLIGAGVLMLAILMIGTQFLRTKLNQKVINKLQNKIVLLETERDRLLKAAPPKLDTSKQSGLSNIFTSTPKWAKLINDITLRLPGTVWLTQFEGTVRTVEIEESQSEKSKRKKEKGVKTEASSSMTRGLVLKGMARDFTDLARFLASLEDSPYIKAATLISSKKSSAGFTFEIQCDMSSQ